jgi:hypothetical protein
VWRGQPGPALRRLLDFLLAASSDPHAAVEPGPDRAR